MGKRKERRHAALSGPGRRVKLDLWTDDGAAGSGSIGAVASDSLHGEAGSYVDQSHGAAVPSSPSSSGPHQENPLSLLGQYSDDDLGEEESKETKNASVSEPTSSGCASEQVVDFLADLQTHGLLEDNSEHKNDIVGDNINIEHKSSNLANSVPIVVDENAKEETTMNLIETSVTEIKDSTTSTIPDLGSVQKQSTENIDNEWKAVIHEESGQYYYWNVRTGETTWVMPSALVQEVTTFSQETNSLKLESSQDIHLGLNEGSLEEEPGVPGVEEKPASTKMLPQVSVVSPCGYVDKEQEEMQDLNTGYHLDEQLKEPNGEVRQTCCEKHNVDLNDASCAVNESRFEDGGTVNSILSEQTVDGDLSNDEIKVNGVKSLESTEEPNVHEELPGFKQDVQQQSPDPLELLKWSEKLSQRFKALEGTSDSVRAPTLRVRYAVEAEIRLADCKALSSCGGSLEPYWLHAQAQLKRLESVLCVEEAAISAGAEQSRILHSRRMSSSSFASFRSRITSKTMSNESGGLEQDKTLAPVKDEYHVTTPKIEEECAASPLHDHMPSPQDDGHMMFSQDEEHMHSPKHQASNGSPDQVHIGDDTCNDLEEGEIKQLDVSGILEITGDDLSSPQETKENISKKDVDTSFERAVESSNDGCEVIDMEVDMEVDDQTGNETSVHEEVGLSSYDGYALQSASVDPSLPLTTSVVSADSRSLFPIHVGDNAWGAQPQPPEEDWAPPQPPDGESIPPPPPDGESIPPPPPDEPPPSPSSPPAPCSGYEEPLCPALPYTEQYTSAYVPMANYNYYTSASTEAPNPNYYVAADVQTDGTQMSYSAYAANAYAEGTSLGNPVEGVIYYESTSTVPESLELHNPQCSTYYENVDASTYYGTSGVTTGISQVPTGSITAVTGTSLGVHAAEVISTQVSTCVASSSTVSAATEPSTAGGAAGVKSISKDVRNKKRSIAVAPTLRSNKKVSSLVDKWKAAKEELHGSDDEDENEKALEVLEKKRQREIEEWRMQQIASGEAQVNANFQPLGGDWRERVKRRKTEAVAEKTKSESSSVTVNAESNGAVERKKPNLAEHSKDLPAGWQAFWDESSGEVYYGNLTTSETTWDRPK